MTSEKFDLDTRKLNELILYVARRCDMLPSWGKTKLCKMLFHSDFEAYRRLGRPITGSAYFRMPQGPVPKAALKAMDELVSEGRLALIEREIGDYKELRPTAITDPDITVFRTAEMAVIEQAIALLSPLTAKEASDWSHRQPGWALVEPGGEIPYCLSLDSVRRPTDDELDYVRSLVAAEMP